MSRETVNVPAIAARRHMHAAVAVAHTRRADLLDARFEAGLIGATGLVVVAGCVELDHATSPPDRNVPVLANPHRQPALAIRPQSTPSAPCFSMNVFCASDNFDAFIVFGSSQPRGPTPEDSTQKRSSLTGADHTRTSPAASCSTVVVSPAEQLTAPEEEDANPFASHPTDDTASLATTVAGM